MISFRELVNGFREVGLVPGRPVIVHASLSSFGEEVRGGVGSLLGAAGVNISAIQVSQEARREIGLMALALESEVPQEVQERVRAEEGVVATRTLHFGAGD